VFCGEGQTEKCRRLDRLILEKVVHAGVPQEFIFASSDEIALLICHLSKLYVATILIIF
jgi:hypothetical protein